MNLLSFNNPAQCIAHFGPLLPEIWQIRSCPKNQTSSIFTDCNFWLQAKMKRNKGNSSKEKQSKYLQEQSDKQTWPDLYIAI